MKNKKRLHSTALESGAFHHPGTLWAVIICALTIQTFKKREK